MGSASHHSALDFRLIVESLPHIVWCARIDGWADYFNAHLREYSGLATEELEGWRWTEIVHPEDRQRTVDAWGSVLQSGETLDLRCRLRRVDGSYRWHHVTALLTRTAENHVSRWVATAIELDRPHATGALPEDLREEPRLELHLSEWRFKAFMANSLATAWIKDSRLRYVYVNSRYEELTGKRFADMAGREDFEIWEQPVAKQFREYDQEVLRRGAPVHTVEKTVHGGARYWLVTKFPLPDATGAMGVAGTSIDVTDRIREGDADSLDPDAIARLAHARVPGAWSVAAGSSADLLGRLSDREREVLKRVVEGHSSAEIAAQLGLSPKSVETYRSRVMMKLGVHDLPRLVKLAVRSGLTRA